MRAPPSGGCAAAWPAFPAQTTPTAPRHTRSDGTVPARRSCFPPSRRTMLLLLSFGFDPSHRPHLRCTSYEYSPSAVPTRPIMCHRVRRRSLNRPQKRTSVTARSCELSHELQWRPLNPHQ
ncbi:hypothetical protein WMY93_033659 [Mugilogobius chulae]|uniref:Uncharacterized protein n=1 Tax=Mugilogobius chulae TaxID=88201 RepID=A0AAW0MT18_9GOBI